MKTCTGCETPKPKTEFYGDPRRKDGLQSRCKGCYSSYGKGRYTKKADELKEWQRQYRLQHPLAVRRSTMRSTYGITIGEFAQILHSQGGTCGVCRRADPGPKGWHVDHDHDTGVVRGILCHFCNTALGGFRDDVTTLRQAVEYLETTTERVLSWE